jgi:SEC-C motif
MARSWALPVHLRGIRVVAAPARDDADGGGVTVAKLGRNEPCPCGAGRKVKRCCGQSRGPSADDLGWLFLRQQARKFAPVLRDYEELELAELLERVIEMPVRHLSLQVRLPPIWRPELERLREAMVVGNDLADVVQDATAAIDGPLVRVSLARAAGELCQRDKLDVESVAVIMVDLARPTSVFVSASLIAATSVALGRCPTPAGLLIAVR